MSTVLQLAPIQRTDHPQHRKPLYPAFVVLTYGPQIKFYLFLSLYTLLPKLLLVDLCAWVGIEKSVLTILNSGDNSKFSSSFFSLLEQCSL